MLRAALPLSRRAVLAPSRTLYTAQWTSQSRLVERSFATTSTTIRSDKNTKPSIHDPTPPVLPGSQSTTATTTTAAPQGPVFPGKPVPIIPVSDKTIPPSNVPLTPSVPSAKATQIPPPAPSPSIRLSATDAPVATLPLKSAAPRPPSAAPPLPGAAPPPSRAATSLPPPLPKRKPRRFRRFLLTLTLLTGLSYAGGVWYSLVSDNFHDFFTEYIPFGEEAVLYFEEREFRKRFPNATNMAVPQSSRDADAKITIPSKSGLSWRVAESEQDGGNSATKGRHMSAVDANTPEPEFGAEKLRVEQAQQTATLSTGSKIVENVKSNASSPSAAQSSSAQPLVPEKRAPNARSPGNPVTSEELPGSGATNVNPPKSEPVPSAPSRTSIAKPKKIPEVDEPSVYIPITRIDPLKVDNADEPLVQDLVKILNDIITVVNADNATGKFTSTITKAKNELSIVGQRIVALKNAEREEADKKVKSTQGDFDNAARELVRRLEEEIRDQEGKWRDEFDAERERIANTYQERLKSEVEKSQQAADQRLRNQLLEQAVALKKEFASGIKDRVEIERNGRLAKLSELSASVNELEKLTSEWNSVIDANLKTQHLQVAVEAVRSTLERADRPRPFIKELAALKEIAADDPIVNSAIASISPSAYQLGVPTSAQLIDRFRRVADEVRKAALLPEDAGVASHAANLVLSKVMFKKHGRAVGDDVESVLTRTETLLEEGNLDDAAREMNSLSGWARTLSGDWLAEVRRVLEVRQALEVIATEARLQSLKVD